MMLARCFEDTAIKVVYVMVCFIIFRKITVVLPAMFCFVVFIRHTLKAVP